MEDQFWLPVLSSDFGEGPLCDTHWMQGFKNTKEERKNGKEGNAPDIDSFVNVCRLMFYICVCVCVYTHKEFTYILNTESIVTFQK